MPSGVREEVRCRRLRQSGNGMSAEGLGGMVDLTIVAT